DVAGADGVAGRDAHLFDGARLLGADVVLHLHRLAHAPRLTELALFALGHEHLHDGALHRRADRAAPGRAAGCARARTGTRRALLGRGGAGGGLGHPELHRVALAVDLDRDGALEERLRLLAVGGGGFGRGGFAEAGGV